MKTQAPMLAAAALLAATAARAATGGPAYVNQFINREETQAQAQLAAAGVNLNGRTATVQVTVNGDGLDGAHVVSSSGSAATDDAITSALRQFPIDSNFDIPTELIGSDITLDLGQPSGVQDQQAPAGQDQDVTAAQDNDATAMPAATTSQPTD
jgi:hypothetical protein